MICPQCKSTETVKSGIVKQKQRFLCKNCNHQFLDYQTTSTFNIKNTHRRIALHLFLEGLGTREIARILQMAPTTLSNWKKEWSCIHLDSISKTSKPEHLNYTHSIEYINARKNASNYTILWLDLEIDVSFIANFKTL